MVPSHEEEEVERREKLVEHKTRAVVQRLFDAVEEAEDEKDMEKELVLRAIVILHEHDVDTLRNVWFAVTNLWNKGRESDEWDDETSRICEKVRGYVFGAYKSKMGVSTEDAWEALTGSKFGLEEE